MRVLQVCAIVFAVTAGLGISAIATAAPATLTGVPLAAFHRPAQPMEEPTATITPTTTITPTVTVTPTETITPTTSANRVAEEIAANYGITLTKIVELHNTGIGYGEIVIALELAKASGKSLEEILAMKDQETGWGEIAQALGIAPGKWGGNLGDVMSQANPKKSATPPAGDVAPKGNVKPKDEPPGNGKGRK